MTPIELQNTRHLVERSTIELALLKAEHRVLLIQRDLEELKTRQSEEEPGQRY